MKGYWALWACCRGTEVPFLAKHGCKVDSYRCVRAQLSGSVNASIQKSIYPPIHPYIIHLEIYALHVCIHVGFLHAVAMPPAVVALGRLPRRSLMEALDFGVLRLRGWSQPGIAECTARLPRPLFRSFPMG